MKARDLRNELLDLGMDLFDAFDIVRAVGEDQVSDAGLLSVLRAVVDVADRRSDQAMEEARVHRRELEHERDRLEDDRDRLAIDLRETRRLHEEAVGGNSSSAPTVPRLSCIALLDRDATSNKGDVAPDAPRTTANVFALCDDDDLPSVALGFEDALHRSRS